LLQVSFWLGFFVAQDEAGGEAIVFVYRVITTLFERECVHHENTITPAMQPP